MTLLDGSPILNLERHLSSIPADELKRGWREAATRLTRRERTRQTSPTSMSSHWGDGGREYDVTSRIETPPAGRVQ